MRRPRAQFTVRGMILAVAAAGLALRVGGSALDAYDARRYGRVLDEYQVMGEVKVVDAANDRAELSLGSDDGLVTGDDLYLFRVGQHRRYIGTVRLDRVGRHDSSGRVRDTRGLAIRPGDAAVVSPVARCGNTSE